MAFSSSGPIVPPNKAVMFGSSSGPIVPPNKAVMFGRGAGAPNAAGAGAGAGGRLGASPSPPRARPQPERSPTPPRVHSPPTARGKGSAIARQGPETARDEEAKARRLQRFGAEKPDKVEMVAPAAVEGPGEQMVEDQDWQGRDAILGTCPDMCAEVERLARERKGDLDKFERLDGDRHQSSVHLAVKKYTRTADKEASVIRPLPVLEKTMDHLLRLLDRPYDDELLSLHSFLWDRMRAVRMDLRMQHIFNLEAIRMHEQMIRFHIAAMHELCEYAKGEGFNEGFDPHLNIEQMNKASVDLFEMYVDHRRRGTPVASEPEFRGYYALLKLDKHPGYLVEPAELSLDLAKMTPELRNAPEVLFARAVARASRSGNYIAFFRLARKATYLQACLMHAHFSKLRVQALSSLHSGLQKSQGIPVSKVVDWLGIEEDNPDTLIGYSESVGFAVKDYEKKYLVKEGPYVTPETPFPTRRSQLVVGKRSTTVVADVQNYGRLQSNILPSKHFVVERKYDPGLPLPSPSSPAPEEDMPDYEEEQQVGSAGHPEVQMVVRHEPSPQRSKRKGDSDIEVGSDRVRRVRRDLEPQEQQIPADVAGVAGREREEEIYRRGLEVQAQERAVEAARIWAEVRAEEAERQRARDVAQYREQVAAQRRAEEFARQRKAEDDERRRLEVFAAEKKRQEEEEQKLRLAAERKEAYLGLTRLWTKRWKLRTEASLEQKRRRRERAQAALLSLSAGPPLRGQKSFEEVFNFDELDLKGLNFNEVYETRKEKLEQMWAGLDILSLTSATLVKNNPSATCICWKLVVCSRVRDMGDQNGLYGKQLRRLGRWLWTKVTAHSLKSRTWLQSSSSVDLQDQASSVAVEFAELNGVALSYIARDVGLGVDSVDSKESFYGASGVLFLLVDTVPIVEEQTRLRALVESITPGAQLPLLVIASSRWRQQCWERQEQRGETAESALASILQIQDFPTSQVAYFAVVFIGEAGEEKSENAFLDDKALQDGVGWLVERSPKQPDICPLHLRDLVLEHLAVESKSLRSVNSSPVKPQDCILSFNRALGQAAMDISKAASSSALHWPPPEVKSVFYEHNNFPRHGWNLPATLDPMLQVLQYCVLPPFPVMDSKEGASRKHQAPTATEDVVQAISAQKTAISHVLQRYLCQVDGRAQANMAVKQEVEEILQTSCEVKWLGSGGASVLPIWPEVFRRIFHSRLSLLCSEPPPIVYVFPRDPTIAAQAGLYATESTFSGGYFYKRPRLDNIVEQYAVSKRPRTPAVPPSREVSQGEPARAKDTTAIRAPDPFEIWTPAPLFLGERAQSIVDKAEYQVDQILARFSQRVKRLSVEPLDFPPLPTAAS